MQPADCRRLYRLYPSSVIAGVLVVLLASFSVVATAQVRITYEGDTLKGNVRAMTEYSLIYTWGSFIKSVYSCDSVNRLEMVSFSDEKGIRTGGKWQVKFDDAGRVIEDMLYCATGAPCKITTYKYDVQGKKTEQRVTDCRTYDCEHLTDWLSGTITEWVMGEDTITALCSYKYDDMGRIVETREESINVRHTDTIVKTTTDKYYGNTAQVAEFGDKEVDVIGGSIDSAGSLYKYQYNDKGNKIEEYTSGWRYNNAGTYAGRKLFSYDARNKLLEEKGYYLPVYNDDAKPNSGTRIGAGMEYAYDSLGNQTFYTYYQLYKKGDGAEIKKRDAVKETEHAEVDEKEYDKQGNLVRKTLKGTIIFKREIEYY